MLLDNYTVGGDDRYSAKRTCRPTNFIYFNPKAKRVSVVGDFNDWIPKIHPMRRQPDGGWHIQIPLSHGHHRYLLWVDGQMVVDPRAQGTTRNENDERVCLIAVS
jgi:1,4-alpha-glucan branching enzyme